MRAAVLRHPLDRWVDPERAFRALHGGSADAAWLDDSAGSGRSGMGAAVETVVAPALSDDVIARLREGIAGADEVDPTADRAADPAVDPFPLGWIGWVDYESRSFTMGPSSEASRSKTAAPGAAFLRIERGLVFDHATRTVELVAIGDAWEGEVAAWRERTLRELAALDRALEAPDRPFGDALVAKWRDSDERYLDMIGECLRAIERGDAYQLCLTTSADVRTTEQPLDVYSRLRASSPTHHGGFIRIGGTVLASASPEQFLSVSIDGVVSSSPIKGTRARMPDERDDARARDELVASDKERAENLMIVDLVRNDIARVCDVGSVEVSRLFDVESYAHVHQLVSEVRGSLRAGCDALDALVACFPAGSMTGAPKSSATRILAQLERAPRGVYSGVFGRVGLDGSLDLAMVIRSIVFRDGRASVGAGGGITALSDPRAELAEVKLKAAPLLAALGALGAR